MKNPHDPRHRKRQQLIEELFKYDFHKQRVSKEAKEILQNTSILDKEIGTIAPDFPVEKINRVDLAVLRLAVYELIIRKQAPPKVIIDEAIELAKEYGGDSSPHFINGALGKFLQRL